jgi:hypothetical protein
VLWKSTEGTGEQRSPEGYGRMHLQAKIPEP